MRKAPWERCFFLTNSKLIIMKTKLYEDFASTLDLQIPCHKIHCIVRVLLKL